MLALLRLDHGQTGSHAVAPCEAGSGHRWAEGGLDEVPAEAGRLAAPPKPDQLQKIGFP